MVAMIYIPIVFADLRLYRFTNSPCGMNHADRNYIDAVVVISGIVRLFICSFTRSSVYPASFCLFVYLPTYLTNYFFYLFICSSIFPFVLLFVVFYRFLTFNLSPRCCLLQFITELFEIPSIHPLPLLPFVYTHYCFRHPSLQYFFSLLNKITR
jgi:hypothetical protein